MGPSADANLPPDGATLTELADGRVLLASPTGSYLFDPATLTWTQSGSMNQARAYATATRLANGDVLVAGGYAWSGGAPRSPVASAELYDPNTGSWTLTGAMGPSGLFTGQRARAEATLLATAMSSSPTALTAAEIS